MRPRERADASAGSMTLSIIGWLVMALLVGVGTSALLLWAFGWPSLPRSAEFTAANTIELLKIVLAVIAGFGGVVLLSVNHRKQKVAEGDHRLALRNEEREKSKFLNERFAAAAEQLAHDSDQVRLAGVYALAGLADDWDEGRQKCVELLISYLRLAEAGESEVVDTIFRMFRERLTRYSAWSDVKFDFTGMKLVDADFSGCKFRAAVTFDRVVFSGKRTSFADAWFSGALHFRETEFLAEIVDFKDASFDDIVEFRDARFLAPLDLSGAWLDRGAVGFLNCKFEADLRAAGIIVNPGLLLFMGCEFRNSLVGFQDAQFGDLFESWRWSDALLGRSQVPKRGKFRMFSSKLLNSSLSMDGVHLRHGRVVIQNVLLRGGHLRIKPADRRHPSLDVRRIAAQDAEVDIPLPDRFWKEGRVTVVDDTPQSSERDGHRGVGQDGADVREEL